MRINREKFAAAMARMDLNIVELSKRSCVSRVTVSAIKAGKSCSLETAQKLAAVLGDDIIERRV